METGRPGRPGDSQIGPAEADGGAPPRVGAARPGDAVGGVVATERSATGQSATQAGPPPRLRDAAARNGSAAATASASAGASATTTAPSHTPAPPPRRPPASRRTRSFLGLGAGATFTLLVLAHGAGAWESAEERALDAAEAEGRALLAAVTAGVEASLDASAAVESLVAERLAVHAREIADAVVASPGLEESVLAEEVRRRRLAGAAILDLECGLVAATDAACDAAGPDASGPFAAERIARLAATDLANRLRAAPPTDGRAVVVGFREGPFTARTEITVAVRAPALPGFVLVRSDATRVEEFRRDTGVARVLRETSKAPGIAFLALQDDEGTCIASGEPGLVGAVLPAAPPRAAWTDGPGGRRTLDLAVPVAWAGGPHGSLRVALDAAPVDAVVLGARRDVALMTSALLATGLGALAVIAALDRRRHANESRLRDELARRERFAALGRAAAGVAHEIRGPLNALSLAAQILARACARGGDVSRDRVVAETDAIRAAVRRADDAVGDFLALARGARDVDPAPTDVAAIVSEAVAAEGGRAATHPPDAAVVVSADRRLLVRAVANLVRNALQSAPPDTVRVAWRRDGESAVIDVDDGGPGVPPDQREAVFEPFRTTRPDGTGLGLAIARDAVERHGGTIEVLDAPGGGARFRIRLPATNGEPARDSRRASADAGASPDNGTARQTAGSTTEPTNPTATDAPHSTQPLDAARAPGPESSGSPRLAGIPHPRDTGASS